VCAWLSLMCRTGAALSLIIFTCEGCRMFIKHFLRGSCLAAICLTAACGSGSATTGGTGVTTNPPVTTAPVKGIATPNSVSVVTATHATN
jgi:hypothetical protein